MLDHRSRRFHALISARYALAILLCVAAGTEAQTATTGGEFWAAFTTARPFRATDTSELEAVPATAPSTVQRWADNPQLLLVNTKALGGVALNASATTEYTGSSELAGIVDYHVSTQGYTGLLLTSDSARAVYEYQILYNSPNFSNEPKFGVRPKGVTVGISYRLR
jgi:hypothetical protein